MPIESEDLERIFQLGHEQQGVEFKCSAPGSYRPFFARVARAIMAMANHKDGGLVVLGVEECDQDGTTVLMPTGVASADLPSWSYDDVASRLGGLTDPTPSIIVANAHQSGKTFVIIEVSEFHDVPILCRKTIVDQSRKTILREGACYVRPRRKAESVEVGTVIDMRDLLDLAIDKGLRNFVKRAFKAGMIASAALAATPSDATHFREQIKDFIQ